jgi:RimJ/RimL family protein N-acetyltransferase
MPITKLDSAIASTGAGAPGAAAPPDAADAAAPPRGPPCTVSCTLPPRSPLRGRYTTLEPLAESHSPDLAAAWELSTPHSWAYLFAARPADAAAAGALVAQLAGATDALHFAVLDASTGRALGSLALMRIDLVHGVVELGHVNFTSPLLSQTRLATEAVALMVGLAFARGFRRVEWKCDALNAPSRRAALRFGFVEEGVFRKHMVIKGHARDTAWFSLLADEWPRAEAAFNSWLAAANFDEGGRQRAPLAAFRRAP